MEDARTKILARRARFVAAALVAAGFSAAGQNGAAREVATPSPSSSDREPSPSESASTAPEFICEKYPEACVCLKVVHEVEPKHQSSCGCDTPGRR